MPIIHDRHLQDFSVCCEEGLGFAHWLRFRMFRDGDGNCRGRWEDARRIYLCLSLLSEMVPFSSIVEAYITYAFFGLFSSHHQHSASFSSLFLHSSTVNSNPLTVPTLRIQIFISDIPASSCISHTLPPWRSPHRHTSYVSCFSNIFE
jgi:hypothetical protein